MPELQGEIVTLKQIHTPDLTNTSQQRQHSANVLEAPKAYPQQEPAKAQNILTMDCRGLEFVDFKADVRSISSKPIRSIPISIFGTNCCV